MGPRRKIKGFPAVGSSLWEGRWRGVESASPHHGVFILDVHQDESYVLEGIIGLTAQPQPEDKSVSLTDGRLCSRTTRALKFPKPIEATNQ